MTLRARVTLASGFAVLLAVVAVSIAVYLVVRSNLHNQIDESLSHFGPVDGAYPLDISTVPQYLPLLDDAYFQVVDRDGEILTMFDNRSLPVTRTVLAVARGERADAFFDAEVDDSPVRVYVASIGHGAALQVGRSLVEIDQALRQLVLTLVVISVGAVAVASVTGRLVAAAVTAPVRRVSKAAETVAATGDLSHHIAVPGGDDLGRLAASFNTMLDALSESLSQQRQLVADASHELRTPLATVRTNVEVLARADELAPDDRNTLIADTVTQIGELTGLVGDLVELARGDGREEPFTVIRLDDITMIALEGVKRNYPSIEFRVDGHATAIRGAPARVSRAVSNLIDNAAKWSPPGGAVEISVRDGIVTVSDTGPGVDSADLPHVFERFYRAPEARTMPGSGLGLAIVNQVAGSHGGTVTAGTASEGGARFVLQFPTVSASAGPVTLHARNGAPSSA